MRNFMIAIIGAMALAATAVQAAPLKIDSLVVSKTIPAEQSKAEITAATAFYRFWSTGSQTDLEAAIAPSFFDHTLPPGRPQGPAGPAFASKNFRAAVPDLTCEVRKMVVAGDYVTVHMVFKGHFTGTFGKVKGKGQKIDFIATDLLKLTNGKVTDNWHIEDNLTLLSQMGVAKVEQ